MHQPTTKNDAGATRRNIKDTFRPAVPLYKGIRKKYTAYIDKQRAEGVLAGGPKYLTRDNVDTYFLEVVAYFRTVQPVWNGYSPRM